MKMNEKKSPRSSIVAPFLLLKKMVNFFLSLTKTKKNIAKHCNSKEKHGKAAQCARSVLYCFTAQYYTAVFKYIPLG